MKSRILAVAVIVGGLVLGTVGFAGAAPIFSDNFDSENGGIGALNYSGFANWSVLGGGTVDLIGNGYYDLQPGHGLYVDLDGSTYRAGIMFSRNITVPVEGNYVLSFQLAGNHRNSTTEAVTAMVFFGGLMETLFIPSTQDFTTYTRTLHLYPGDVNLLFSDVSSDNVGALLDNIEIAPVPEPGTIVLLAGGLLGLVGYGRKRRQHKAA